MDVHNCIFWGNEDRVSIADGDAKYTPVHDVSVSYCAVDRESWYNSNGGLTLLNSNPFLSNTDYHLNSSTSGGQACIDHGTDTYSDDFNLSDLDGDKVLSDDEWDIGVDEYNSSYENNARLAVEKNKYTFRPLGSDVPELVEEVDGNYQALGSGIRIDFYNLSSTATNYIDFVLYRVDKGVGDPEQKYSREIHFNESDVEDGHVVFEFNPLDGQYLETGLYVVHEIYYDQLVDGVTCEFWVDSIESPETTFAGSSTTVAADDAITLTLNCLPANIPVGENQTEAEARLAHPIEYRFVSVKGSGASSDWKDSTSYQINGLEPGHEYSYAVKTRFENNANTESDLSDPCSYLPLMDLEIVQAAGSKALLRILDDYSIEDFDEGIQFSFNGSSGSSGWIDNVYWADENASSGSTYTLQYRFPDPNDSEDTWIESGDSNSISASDVTWGATDDLAPFPSPMRWAADPTVSSDLSTITLTAVTAIDINETIDYNFVCVTDANYTSGWRSLPTYEANSLPINTAFTFTVQARDGAGNVGEASDPVTAWTDNTPPTTNSGDFNLTVSYSNIIAVLDVNEDVNEFWIARVPSTGISSDDDVIKSYGWQEVDEGATSVGWTDYTRAEGGETFWYSYRVRDDANNATAWSTPISATTVVDDRYPSPDPMAWDANTPIHYEGKTCVIIAAQEAVLPSTLGAPIEYRFNCSDANFTSDWQDSPVCEIRGLQPSTSYYFTVQARRGDYGYEDYVTDPSSSLTVTTLSGAWTQYSIVRDVELDIWYEDLGIAMFEAASGHHLEIQPGTYSLTEPLTFAYNSGLTLCSTDPEDANVVAATILNASQCAPIVVFQGETWEDPVTSRLEGLTITGADDPNVDGAIQVQGYSSAALSNCVLSYNTTGNGGAIYTYTGSELLLSDCILHDNTADLADGFKGFGGAIYGSTVTLSDCELYENQADRGGGAIYVTDLTMTRCSVHDNESMGHGGAVYSSRPSLANCQIYNNSSEDQGGGLYSYTSASTPATLTNCLFKNNDAVDGGGLRCTGNPGAAVIRGCVFVDNTSSQDGGGISMNGELTLSNCTVVDNAAISTGAGGGIYQGNGDFDLINCLFAGNTPTPYPSGNIYSPDLYSCLIQGATLNGSYAYLNGDPIGQLEGGVLLGSDPLLVDDYHLDPNSPCVDAGLNSVTKPITDIDGELRTVNGTVDIGADEYFEADEIPPSPVAWDIAPVAVDCNTVTMTAVIASDASGPVVYRFECNDANFSSGWQIDPNYTVDGLTPEATYSFSLQARDAAGNLSSATSDSYVTLPSETASFVATNLTGGGSYETIEAALDDASNGDVIQIQTGTYDVALDLDGLDITLCGTDPNDPNVVAATILTNSNDGPVLTFPTGSNCQIKGLTIADSNNFTGSGGGVYASYSNLTFHQCRFVNCHSNGDGGGLYGYRCDINLWNCIFMDNNATGSGGGAYCYPYNFNDDEVHVVGCVFYQNSATSGGGFCCDGGYVWGLGWCTHSTFVDNTASSDSGAIYGVKYIDSSIFWGNRSPDVGDYHIGGSAPYMTGGLIEGAHESSTAIKASDNSTIGNKNGGVFVFDDPNFTDGYHLSSDSCAIDMGSYSEDLLLMDIDGEPRFVADLDLGADEVYRSGAPIGYRFGSTVESIANNTDDVGQKTTHYVNAYSQYLVMGLDDTYEMVGLRFTDVNIPNGSAIYSAYLEFSCDDPNSEDCSLTIVGQDSDDAVAFSGSRYDVSSRTATTASVSWDVEDWDTSGAIYASVDISSVIEEIVQRPGWSEGNALVLMISGTGQRYAESLEGGYATTLHIVRYLEMQ